MIELGISQAQSQFTKLLDKEVIIVDKKAHQKKAVILPYEEYTKLLSKAISTEDLEEGAFSRFEGVLDREFKTDDERYKAIVL